MGKTKLGAENQTETKNEVQNDVQEDVNTEVIQNGLNPEDIATMEAIFKQIADGYDINLFVRYLSLEKPVLLLGSLDPTFKLELYKEIKKAAQRESQREYYKRNVDNERQRARIKYKNKLDPQVVPDNGKKPVGRPRIESKIKL
jgi:hypothetical protein